VLDSATIFLLFVICQRNFACFVRIEFTPPPYPPLTCNKLAPDPPLNFLFQKHLTPILKKLVLGFLEEEGVRFGPSRMGGQ